jgi:hypothetical protein
LILRGAIETKRKRIPESFPVFIAGLSTLATSLVALMLMLPGLTPYQFLSCQLPDGAGECSSSFNSLYPLVFFVSIGGTLLLFIGLFGLGYISKPLFIFGIFLIEFGLLVVISRFLNMEWCTSQTGKLFGISCTTQNPDAFYFFIALGVLSLSLHTYRHLHNAPPPKADTVL